MTPTKLDFKMVIRTIYTVIEFYPFEIKETIEARNSTEIPKGWEGIEFYDEISAELCQLEKQINWLNENQQVGQERRVKLFKLKKRYNNLINQHPEKVI